MKSGKTKSPTSSPSTTPIKYCVDDDGVDSTGGKCAALEASFIATNCAELIATFPPFGSADRCVAADVAKDFLFCSAICETSLWNNGLVCDPTIIPTMFAACGF
jgi:hypothetical protein